MNKPIKKLSGFSHKILSPVGVIMIAGALLVMAWLIFFSGPDVLSPVPSTELLKNHDWSHMAGATQIPGGLDVAALGRAIVNQDGTSNQDNPPVNARGAHAEFNGSLRLSIRISRIPANGNASFYIYSAPPIVYDEWRYQPPQLRVDLNQKQLTAYVWNGKSDKYAAKHTWASDVGTGAYVSVNLSQKSRSIRIYLDGKPIGSIKAKDIFQSGQLWFGADNSVGNQPWSLSSVTIQPLGKSKLAVIDQSSLSVNSLNPNGLRAVSSSYTRNLPIGAAIASYPLFSDPGYRKLVASQIDQLTPENELKAQFTEPQPNLYTFTDADNLIDFALANGMSVHGHSLVFSEANPQWMQSAPLNQRQQIMVNHITTEVSHFGNKINEWDVVDEPLNDDDDNNGNASDLRQNIWFAAMGEHYIDTAFNTAHRVNPGAILYLNEYGLEANGTRWDELLSLVKRLQARHVPINGVGFQAHVYEPGDEVDTETLVKHMAILQGLGLKVRVSEADVYGDDAQHQADQYSAILKACLESPNCTSFSMWGLSDRYGSTADLHIYPVSDGNALVWDDNLKPKLAYNSLINTLE